MAEALILEVSGLGPDKYREVKEAFGGAGVPEPSHVVRAMGLGEDAARSALRLTLGRTTTEGDVDAVISALPAAYERARTAGLSSRQVGAPRLGGAAGS